MLTDAGAFLYPNSSLKTSKGQVARGSHACCMVPHHHVFQTLEWWSCERRRKGGRAAHCGSLQAFSLHSLEPSS